MHVERKEALMRIVVLVVSGIILWLWKYPVYFLMILHWIIALISAKRHEHIAEFVEHWNSEYYKFFRYLSGVSNEKPFPFAPLKKISKFEK